MPEIKALVGQRGNVLLEVERFKFRKHRDLLSGEIRWRCCKNSCSASMKTSGSYTITESNFEHNHEPLSSRDLTRQSLSSAAKRKAEEQLSERPSKILRSLLDENNIAVLRDSDLALVKRNMYYAKRKSLGQPLPKSRREVHAALSSLNLKTINGEEVLLINDHDSELVVFSCLTNLKALVEANSVYLDGTFKFCPKFFEQMLTIHGFFNGHYIPLVYVIKFMLK